MAQVTACVIGTAGGQTQVPDFKVHAHLTEENFFSYEFTLEPNGILISLLNIKDPSLTSILPENTGEGVHFRANEAILPSTKRRGNMPSVLEVPGAFKHCILLNRHNLHAGGCDYINFSNEGFG